MEGALNRRLARARLTLPTCAEAGATRDVLVDGAPLPAGYHHLRVTRPIGRGVQAFDAAADSLLGWGVHRGSAMRVAATTPRATPGTTVVAALGVGPLRMPAPCRVVWAVDDPATRRGFGYATLPGHPEDGEEAFLVELDGTGEVRFTVVAFSRPARWFARAAGPLGPILARQVALLYVRAARRAAAG
ncbi:MAG TPA: DUF1990 domain-containing protein [Kineosporiaceae bacterium]